MGSHWDAGSSPATVLGMRQISTYSTTNFPYIFFINLNMYKKILFYSIFWNFHKCWWNLRPKSSGKVFYKSWIIFGTIYRKDKFQFNVFHTVKCPLIENKIDILVKSWYSRTDLSHSQYFSRTLTGIPMGSQFKLFLPGKLL